MTLPVHTLLLVDDVAPARAQYRRCLLADSSCVYRFLEAENAIAGLELCRTQAIDAILLDYSLPDQSGLAFLEALNAQSSDHPPVVMVSGEGDESLAVRAIKLGAEDYLTKRRLTPELLQLTIRSAIENAGLKHQLQQSQDRFRVSIENMLDCFGIYSSVRDESGQIVDFRIDYLNTAALESNRMTIADIGRALCEAFPSHRDVGLFEAYCRVVETGDPLIREDLIYSDLFGAQLLTRAYDLHVSKLGDGFVASWRDVTERKQAELALRETNQRITTIWESMTDAYVTLDRGWRITYANRAAAQVILQLAGLEPEAFLGKSHWEVFPSLVGQAIEQEYQRAVSEQVAVTLEVCYEPTSNWFEVHAYPHTDGLGAYFRDITDRKASEIEIQRLNRELNRRVDELQTILDAVPVGITIADDPTCKVIRANQFAQSMLSVPSDANVSASGEQAETLPFRQLRNREEIPPQDLPMQQATAQGKAVQDVEIQLVRSDGATFDWWVNAVPLFDEQGAVRGCVAAFMDITDAKRRESERQQSEDHLRQQETQLRLFVKHAPAGVAMFDREMHYIVVSDRWLTSYGLTGQDLIGRSHYEVFPELPDRWKAIHQRCLAGAVETCEEDAFPRADGSVDWVRWEIHPWRTDTNEIGGIIIFSEVITDRKQAELALQAANQRISSILESITDAFIALDSDWCYTYVNHAAEQFLGRPRADLLGRSIWELFPAEVETNSPTYRELHRAFAEQIPVKFDGFAPSLGLHIEVSAYPSPEGVAVYWSDISERVQLEAERRQAEAALQEQTNLLQLIIESIGDGLILANPRGEFVLFNQAAERIFGRLTNERSSDEWSRTYGLFLPDQQTLFPDRQLPLYRAMQGEHATDVEVFVRRDPTLEGRWISISGFPVVDANQNITGGVITCRDVTDRKQVEAALRESEQRLQALIDNSNAAIFIKDLQGRYLLINHECERLFHVTNEWACGKTDYDLFSQEVADALRLNDQQVLESGTALTLEEKVPLDDGIHTYVAVKFPLLDQAGVTYAICGISTDISDRIRIEADRDRLLTDAQTAREEAEAANRSKDEFVAMIAHELRSPLNSIMGWANLLQTRTFDPATTTKALETISRNTQTQIRLIEDLLDISRMVRGTLQINLAPVDLAEVMEAAIDIVRPSAAAKAIELKLQKVPTAQVSGDENRLQQIIVNLLTNAIKFTPHAGRVTVGLEQVESRVQIRIHDTGKGIAPEFLPLIFERFQQGQQNAGSKDGLGLGLAIVKHLVDLHSGTITVESPGIGQGSTFTVQLPKLEDSAQKSPNDRPADTSLAGVRILIVDDEPDMLDLITFVLEESGAEVQSATSGVSALECLSKFRPDILVSDIAMPGGNGYELVQQMRTRPEGQIPAIALTAYASITYEERSLQAGFQQHLTKPVEPEDLVNAIINLVRGIK
ncbi:PAS domain-containing protein [Phormidesmis sp. 146-33]